MGLHRTSVPTAAELRPAGVAHVRSAEEWLAEAVLGHQKRRKTPQADARREQRCRWPLPSGKFRGQYSALVGAKPRDRPSSPGKGMRGLSKSMRQRSTTASQAVARPVDVTLSLLAARSARRDRSALSFHRATTGIRNNNHSDVVALTHIRVRTLWGARPRWPRVRRDAHVVQDSSGYRYCEAWQQPHGLLRRS